MAELHRLDRRLFLSQLGRRTAAVAVLSSGVLAACSSDGEIAVPSTDSAGTATSAPPTTALADTTDDASSSSSAAIPPPDAEDFRWERVNLGFVSAYILARGAEIAIVDTGSAGSTSDIERGLASLGAGWADVNNVILTHLHGDHIGSLPDILAEAPAATAHAGRADAEQISSATVEALDDGDEIFGLRVIATPGHTAGHICVLDPGAGFLVAGDAINEQGGMVLGPNPSFTPDMTQANASVRRLAEREYETVVFGHGEPITAGASDAVVAFAQTLS